MTDSTESDAQPYSPDMHLDRLSMAVENPANMAARETVRTLPVMAERRNEMRAGGLGFDLFFGGDGLRWGWALVLFLVVARECSTLLFQLAERVGLLPAALDPHSLAPKVAGWLELVQFGGVLLATLLLAAVERRRVGRYGLGTPAGRVAQAAAGAVWGLVLLSLLVGILRWTGALVLSAPLLHGKSAVRWGLAWAVPFAFTGLFEEMGFRGVVQFTLARGLASLVGASRSPAHTKALGFWAATVLLAMLFGAVHLQNSGESLTGALAAALVGLVLSFSLWRTGSLWWAVGFHAAWDWAESFLYGVSDSGTVAMHTLVQGVPRGRVLLSGGTVGPEGSVWVLPVIALAAVVVAWTLPSQAGSPSDPAYRPEA